MLVLAAVEVGAVLGLLAVDSDKRVAYRATDSTTTAKPTTLSQVRWTLDEPLRITYCPGRAEDDRRTVTIDLRDAGVTALNHG